MPGQKPGQLRIGRWRRQVRRDEPQAQGRQLAERDTASALTRQVSRAGADDLLTVHQAELDNGLQVVINEDPTLRQAAVSLTYRIGSRGEPTEFPGFAHLFEHLMFCGSATVAEGEHMRSVQDAGGSVSAYTGCDYTDYFHQVPVGFLPDLLRLERDRMQNPLINPTAVIQQSRVIAAEIRQNVTTRPLGGFSWLKLPSVVFTEPRNAHNGYGDAAQLTRVDAELLRRFHHEHYRPSNAVMTICSALPHMRVLELVGATLDIPGRSRRTDVRATADLLPTADAIRTWAHPAWSGPAVARGFRVPDPSRNLDSYLPLVVLCDILANGPRSSLRQAAADVRPGHLRATLSPSGDPFELAEPGWMAVELSASPDIPLEMLSQVIETGLRGQAEACLGTDELISALDRLEVGHLLKIGQPVQRARLLGWHAAHGRSPRTAAVLPTLLRAVTPKDVRDASRALLEQPLMELHLVRSADVRRAP